MLDKDSVGFKALVADIEANGLQEQLTMFEGKVLDGRNRLQALKELGAVELRAHHLRDYRGDDPIGYVLSINLHRRHLNESQRAMVAGKLTNLGVGANQHTKGEGTSIDVASKLLNVGRASIDRAKVVLAKGDPSLIEAVEQGTVSVSSAATQAKQQEQELSSQTEQKQSTTTRQTTTKKSPLDRFESAWEDLPTQQAFVEAN
jgi:hypothetical protein